MGTKNYYEILGVGRDADDEAVKQAFREQAKNCHPDRNPGDQHAEHQFKLVNTAYEGLKDAERREAYLEWLEFADKR
ncbi:MAG: DnaJ domain-containing protein, partial [Alphaproteobacteria bacterium]